VKRVAIFARGGVAPPHSAQRVPSIEALIARLSSTFDIRVYVPLRGDGHTEAFRCGDARVTYVDARHDDAAVLIAARMLRAFARDHARSRFSLVHGFWALPGGIAAVAAGRFWGLPSIASMLGGEGADLPAIGYGNMSRRASRAATLWTCTHASRLALLTSFQRERLRAHGLGRDREVHVIPFGAEPDFYRPPVRRAPGPPYNLLNVAHINRVKDQETILRALRRILPDVPCTLRIVGEDTLGGALARRASDMGLGGVVTFAGYAPHREMRTHYDWAHLLCHSSLYEGEGVVVAEASAAGLPVCGTRVGLIADLGEACAAATEPGDDAALADAMRSLLADGARREAMSAGALAWARAHDADWTAAQYATLYEDPT